MCTTYEWKIKTVRLIVVQKMWAIRKWNLPDVKLFRLWRARCLKWSGQHNIRDNSRTDSWDQMWWWLQLDWKHNYNMWDRWMVKYTSLSDTRCVYFHHPLDSVNFVMYTPQVLQFSLNVNNFTFIILVVQVSKREMWF